MNIKNFTIGVQRDNRIGRSTNMEHCREAKTFKVLGPQGNTYFNNI